MRIGLAVALGLTLMGSAARGAGWALVVHGGVDGGAPPAAEVALHRAGLARALAAGGAVLARGGAALDAVEAAVKVLEDDPVFNAGRGAVFSHEGRNELDAAIMDGATLKAGAVAGVTATRNPVSLARAVMEKSPHVLLTGAGADAFSKANGIEQATAAWFRVEERWRELLKARAEGGFDGKKLGTVGAVARDTAGHIAAATSTGGITNKRWGRVGDSPIIGAGTYADDRGCGVSATGSGEYFIRLAVAHQICARVRWGGEPLVAAGAAAVGEVKALGGSGGVILMGRDGPGDWAFTTPVMSRGRIAEGGAADVRVLADEE